MAVANAAGETLQMFVIGRSAKPRCFKNVISLPCLYCAQAKSWMDGEFFSMKGLQILIENETRKAALLVDNCPAHPHVEELKAIDLVFLPPKHNFPHATYGSGSSPLSKGEIPKEDHSNI